MRSVVVVGGGLAGLTAACQLVRRGHQVTLVEARARLGGATFSFDRDGLTVDNGQHVLLRCYTEYRALLDLLGMSRHVDLQDRFHIPVITRDGRRAELTRNSLPAPLHLAGTLATYKLLSRSDRARVLMAAGLLRTLDPADPTLDERSFGDWLVRRGQRPAAIDALWNLITVAALNTDAHNASLALCAMVFRTALLERADAADIGVPTKPLGELHGDAAHRYLTAHDAQVLLHTPVRAVRATGDGFEVATDDRTLTADAVVVAAPPEATAAVLPADALAKPELLGQLGGAPIVNVHAVYDRQVTTAPFTAVVGSPVQWVFDRTATSGLSGSGLAGGQYLAVSLSAAERWIDTPTTELREIFLPELARLFPAAARAEATRFFVTRERRATFRQVPGSARLRPAARTRLPGCVLAGAWTATGWPDTMEGAVRSGNEAARIVDARLASMATVGSAV
ncbi:MAG TPA: hydroxysqualene dehydroxylase HpnE [Pseudonocardiaceae bacterium]|jgi:squalene-associated FAD-dependent desaturase|nr:hydroxysqualene dehydroxylase HpnE [Pseudonocardiaceae bacterium]